MSYAQTTPKKFIVSSVCTLRAHQDEADGFQVAWQINPHMKVGSSSLALAIKEHERFKMALTFAGAELASVPFVRGAYDSVFMKDNALIVEKNSALSALLGTPKMKERQREQLQRALSLKNLGVNIQDKAQTFFEGGDLVVCAPCRLAFVGYGFRTSYEAKEQLEQFLGFPVVPLRLVDPHFYHLDTALNITVTDAGCVAFACRKAFDSQSWTLLQNHPEIVRVVDVPEKEAMHFGLNWVEVCGSVILGSEVSEIKKGLEDLKKKVIVTPLSQFQLAGGSAACLVAPVHNLGGYSLNPRPQQITVSMSGSRSVRLSQ